MSDTLYKQLVFPSDVEGYGSQATQEALYSLACAVPSNHCVVELGVYKGQSLICMAQSGRYCYGVDHFKGEAGGINDSETYGFFDHFAGSYRAELQANLEKYGVADRVTIIESDSQKPEAVDLLLEAQVALGRVQPIGMLVIDAAHDYNSVRKDFQLWSMHVAKGGFIVFDDAQFVDVEAFINKLPHYGWECVGYRASGRLAGAYRKEDI